MEEDNNDTKSAPRALTRKRPADGAFKESLTAQNWLKECSIMKYVAPKVVKKTTFKGTGRKKKEVSTT